MIPAISIIIFKYQWKIVDMGELSGSSVLNVCTFVEIRRDKKFIKHPNENMHEQELFHV